MSGPGQALDCPQVDQDFRLSMPIRPDHVEAMVQYALAIAGEADDHRHRELGPIHLLKYLYLGDLAFARENRGATFSGTQWKFHKFGPWSLELHSQIQSTATRVGARERHFASQYREDNTRWLLLDVDAADIESRLPRPVAAAIRNGVIQYGDDTVSLLHFVYRTAPMLAAAPGELLNLDPPSAEESARVPDQTTVIGTKRLPAISKTKIKKLKERIARIYEERKAREEREFLVPEPPPIYDEIYFQGVEWLDQLAGPRLEETRGRLVFDGSIWKAPGRRDPELP
ncbi:MAG TPA: hypothetical protein VMW75_13820 [Thermoanaerobaculia bacterium]|nr:hypothetical protein [Thermoanaerobaculia bacterium]